MGKRYQEDFYLYCVLIKISNMKIIISSLLLLICIQSFGQDKPVYPEPKPGFKRVDLLLPKIENSRDYKVEIQFSFEANVLECSKASFHFNPKKNLKEEYGIPFNERFPYYVVNSASVEIWEGKDADCKSKEKVNRKIISTMDYLIEYQGYYARPFYIPENWSVEYKIWKASEKYITVK